MDNVEDVDGFEIDIGKYIYIYVHFVCCMYQLFNCLFICLMLKNHFILNGIVEIASVCLMPMKEVPSIILLDDDE